MKYRLTRKQVHACARAPPSSRPGATRARGNSSMLRITQGRAPCRSEKNRVQTSNSRIRAKKLIRVIARVRGRRGLSQFSSGRGFLATGTLQALGELRQALAQAAAQGNLMFVQGALAIGAGMVAGAIGCAAAACVEQGL